MARTQPGGSGALTGVARRRAAAPGRRQRGGDVQWGTSAGERSGRARCRRAGWRHRPEASRATSTPTSATNSGSTGATFSVSRLPHPALNDQPLHGGPHRAGASSPATGAAHCLGEGGGAAGDLRRPSLSYLPSSRLPGAAGEPVTAPTFASVVSRTLYFRPPRTEGSYALSSRLNSTPSIPGAVHVSHSRTVFWVGGRRAQHPRRRQPARGGHGLERGPAPSIRPPDGLRPRQPQKIERDEVGRPLAGRPGSPGAAPLKPVLQLLEGEAARGVPGGRLAVDPGVRRQLRQGRRPDLGERGRHVRAAP